jgi:hypothetical protein
MVDVCGKPLKLSSQNYTNLIEAYVREHTSSKSRRERIRKTLESLNDRVCAGVHNDVTPEEAQALFMQTYLLLERFAIEFTRRTVQNTSDEALLRRSAPQNHRGL